MIHTRTTPTKYPHIARNTKLLLAILMLTTIEATAQKTITLNVKQTFGTRAKLYRYEGKHRLLVDSCLLNANGEYRFTLPADAPQGQYRINIGKTGEIDIIVTNEAQIYLQSVVYAIQDSLRVVESDENRIFIEYQHLKHRNDQIKWFIGSLIGYYPDSSGFGGMLKSEHQRVKINFINEATRLAQINPNLLVSSYIMLDLEPPATDSKHYNESHSTTSMWWNGVDLTKTSLLNTPLLEKKLWNHLEFVQKNVAYTMEQLDSAFVAQISELMRRDMATSIKMLLYKSLCLGFAETDYYGVLEYLISSGGQLASDITSNPDIMERIKNEKSISIGAKALDFTFIPTSSSNKIKLSSLSSPYKLLFFWSAWCPHCIDMLPELKKIYAHYNPHGLEIIAISVDTDDSSISRIIEQNSLKWVNTSFTSENEDKIARKYNIDGTPKMVLLDNKLRVLSKPINVLQLRNKLCKINVDK